MSLVNIKVRQPCRTAKLCFSQSRAIPGRRFRWDFLIGNADTSRLLVEVQGGTWARERSGHSSGSGIARDCEKHNLAVLQGWRTLMFTSDTIKNGEAARIIEEAYDRQKS